MTDQESKAREIARTLQDAGHEAYFAGGCVRDELLGLTPRDYDIATSAHPDVVERLFRRTIAVGRQFGVIVVLMGQDSFDVATFRADFNYGDGRHPENISFTTAKEDVARRDFTINGLLKDPITGEIHDHVGGRADLKAGLVRTIGNPMDRFTEDHLRMLRAVRFASRLGFDLEAETMSTLRKVSANAALPSAERRSAELQKMLTEGHPARALELLRETNMCAQVLPQLADHWDDLVEERLGWEGARSVSVGRRLSAIFESLDGQKLSTEIAWAHLLADLPALSVCKRAREIEKILKDLRVSNESVRATSQLVRVRDRILFASRFSRARKALFFAQDSVSLLCEFAAIQRDFSGSTTTIPNAGVVPTPLPGPLLRGNELMELGVPGGKALGRVIKRLRFLQLQGDCETVAQAEEWVQSIVS